MDDEQMRDEGEVIGAQGQSSPVINQSTVMMTGDEFTDGSIPVREIGEMDWGLWKIPLALHWVVFSHCIVVKVVKKPK